MEQLLHELLAASARRHPNRAAVEDGDRSLTYAELDATSNQLANLLLESGVERGDRVGLFLDKSLESIIGLYGAMKAGAAYVPLDPGSPAPRLGYIVRDCGIKVLLTGGEKSDAWPGLMGDDSPLSTLLVVNEDDLDAVPRIAGDALSRRDVKASAATTPGVEQIDLDLAYILYTSGSTGAPKGVMLSHLNALAFGLWATETFAVGPDDRLSSHAPLHFDLSVFDIFAAAAAGACVVLVPPEASVFPVRLRDFIADRHITVWYSVPSILSMLALRGGLSERPLTQLRTVLFAGEVFPIKYLQRLMELVPHASFHNLYGPTETNVCTWYSVASNDKDRTEPVPIGRAIDGVEVFAVDEDGRRVPPGEVGELLVRGNTVMHGYWGDPVKTERALIADPTGRGLRDVAYRTGDLGRLGEDGNYTLLGRRDHQVKSRGYRIELGEIETAIFAHPDVLECAVLAVPDPIVTNRIHAFVSGPPGLTEREIVRVCGERIPPYMIPDHIEMADALPKTSTGKVDRQALASRVQPAPQEVR
jgi:amino acid adenylation domain-containing protein